RAPHAQRAPRRARRGKEVRPRLLVESLEERCLLDCNPSAAFRTFDGTCNNLAHPEWGSAGVALLRQAPSAYADGISSPTVGNPARPGARAISNTVADQGTADIISARLLSASVYPSVPF